MVSLFVAVPHYGDSIKAECAKSLLALPPQVGVRMEFKITGGGSEIAVARNLIASHFLDETDHTHLLFVDSDMAFSGATVKRQIAAKKPVVGCVYPRKTLDLDKALAAGAIVAGSSFVLHTEGQRIVGNAPLVKVPGIGMGLCLIERAAFRQLLDTGKIRRGTVDGKQPYYGFFDPIIDGERYRSEDYSFCARWRTLCNGEVWALINEDIGHVGEFIYRAKLTDH